MMYALVTSFIDPIFWGCNAFTFYYVYFDGSRKAPLLPAEELQMGIYRLCLLKKLPKKFSIPFFDPSYLRSQVELSYLHSKLIY